MTNDDQKPDHIIELPKSRIELHVEQGTEPFENAIPMITSMLESFGVFDEMAKLRAEEDAQKKK